MKKLSYHTQSSSREIKDYSVSGTELEETIVEWDSESPEIKTNIHKDYTNVNEWTIEPDLFVIISAEKKERNYFCNKEVRGYQHISIVFTCPAGRNSGGNHKPHLGCSPKDFQTHWDKIYDLDSKIILINDREYKIENCDQIFFVSDLDSFRSELKDLLSKEENNQYKWIISNPCFEIWLYYSYLQNDPQTKLKDLINIKECRRSNELKKKVHELCPGGLDPRKAFNYMSQAIENARKYDPGLDNDNIPKLFGTQMSVLAKKIYDRIKSNEHINKHAISFKSNLRK